MKGLELKVFLKQGAIRASNNLSLNLESSHIRDCLHLHESCEHLLVWRDAMGSLEWVHSLNPPPCPKCSSVAVLKFCSHCAEAAAWMWHWEGTPEPHNRTATSSRSNSGCKRASSAFLQLLWLVRHRPGKIPAHNKPSTYGKNGDCRDLELPQPSWEFPFKRWHHQKLMHGESTRTYEWEVQKVNACALFFPSPKYREGKTSSSHKAKETQFLKIEMCFSRDLYPLKYMPWGWCQ